MPGLADPRHYGTLLFYRGCHGFLFQCLCPSPPQQQFGVETVFDYAITDEERIRLGLPTRDAYLEIFEGDAASVNAHLAVLAHIRGNLDARADYIKRLPTEKLNEVLEIIMSKRL